MAHLVKCHYCGEKVDRDSEDAVKVTACRYAHKTCVKQRQEETKKKAAEIRTLKEADVGAKVNKNDTVKCLICGKYIDKSDSECVKATSTRYAHRSCMTDNPEMLEKTEFFDYCSQLFGKQYDHRKTVKLAEKYIKDYPDWTYSGMKKALWYHYEKKHGDKSKAYGSIGILPYVYQTALNYYYELYMAELAASSLTEEQKEVKTREITISEPIKPAQKRKAKILEFEEDEE